MFLLLAVALVAQPPHAAWPKGAYAPKDLKVYAPTNVGQYIVIRDDRPFHAWHDIRRDDPSVNVHVVNPNNTSPWRVSGGMEGLAGWKSIKLTTARTDAVKVWRESIPIAGAGRSLPGFRWSYPDGTVFADLLVNDAGRAFEIRTRIKADGKWESAVPFKDAAASPAGYAGAARCASCHDHAGSSKQYGIMVRGDDSVFSFLPFR